MNFFLLELILSPNLYVGLIFLKYGENAYSQNSTSWFIGYVLKIFFKYLYEKKL